MKKKILDVNVDFGFTIDTAVEAVANLFDTKGSHLIATTSPYFIMRAQQDKEFKRILNESSYSMPDGVGVLQAEAFLKEASNIKRGVMFYPKVILAGLKVGFIQSFKKNGIGEIITGIELSEKLLKYAAENGKSVLLLGGRPRDKKGNFEDGNYDMAADAAEVLRKKYPTINIIGATSQFDRNAKDDTKTGSYIRKLLKSHNISTIDLILIAYGPVFQEKWFARNKSSIPMKVGIGIGRKFDYLTGYMPEPNKIYKTLHIEWLYSLFIQPWRFKRIFMSFPLFPVKVMLQFIKTHKI
ncbi:WecB/TagA/CpsF family glycosyltransferase [Patescibacteria group bacterium]